MSSFAILHCNCIGFGDIVQINRPTDRQTAGENPTLVRVGNECYMLQPVVPPPGFVSAEMMPGNLRHRKSMPNLSW